MSLQITGNIELDGGLQVSSCYARLTADVNTEGNRLRTMVNYYVSKENYNNGSGEIFVMNTINPVFGYNRQTDGVDLLEVAHNKVKAEWEAQGYSVEITEL